MNAVQIPRRIIDKGALPIIRNFLELLILLDNE